MWRIVRVGATGLLFQLYHTITSTVRRLGARKRQKTTMIGTLHHNPCALGVHGVFYFYKCYAPIPVPRRWLERGEVTHCMTES